MEELRANKLDVIKEEKGNILVINTFCFIDNSKAESIKMILQFADKKEHYITYKVFVIGCLSQRFRLDLEKQNSLVVILRHKFGIQIVIGIEKKTTNQGFIQKKLWQ
jgi:tRNA A37 methylthiotransferase MiaB